MEHAVPGEMPKSICEKRVDYGRDQSMNTGVL